MHYVIYPDTLFLENLLCNLLMLGFLKLRFVPAAAWKRIVLAAVLTAFGNTLAAIILFRFHWMIQSAVTFPIAGLTGCFCMEIKDSRRILFLLYQMMLWVLTAGGILQVLEQWTVLTTGRLLVTVGCFTALFWALEKIITIYERQNRCMREIVLYWDGKSRHFRGFADTGNQLFDPVSKKAVTIIAPDAWETLLGSSIPPKYYMIPFQSVGATCSQIKGAQIDYMVILEGRDSRVIERPVIAIANQPFHGIFHYSVLLHNEYC